MKIRTQYFKNYDLLLLVINVVLFVLLSQFIALDIAYSVTFMCYAVFLLLNNFKRYIQKFSGVVVFILASESAIINFLILKLWLS